MLRVKWIVGKWGVRDILTSLAINEQPAVLLYGADERGLLSYDCRAWRVFTTLRAARGWRLAFRDERGDAVLIPLLAIRVPWDLPHVGMYCPINRPAAPRLDPGRPPKACRA